MGREMAGEGGGAMQAPCVNVVGRLLLVAGLAGVVGCAPPTYWQLRFAERLPAVKTISHVPSAPRALAMFDGGGGLVMDWDGLMTAAAQADVVVVGEEHDDEVGHHVELALVQDALRRWPDAAISMEMFERDEQASVDAFLEGRLCTAALKKRTRAERWGKKSEWDRWFQPIVDAVRDAKGRLVAANAPRRYVSRARLDGLVLPMRLANRPGSAMDEKRS